MAEESPFEVILAEPFGQALNMVEDVLKEQDFSVVTRFDVQRTMHDRLNVEFRPFIILGACNNRISALAQQNHPCVEVLMPCNISVEVDPQGQTLVRMADPAQAINCKCDEDPELQAIAEDASQRMKQAVRNLRAATRPQDPNAKDWQRHAADLHE